MTFEVIKYVKATSTDPLTFWGQKLGQTIHKGLRDIRDHKVGHDDLYYDPVTFWGHKLGQTHRKGHRDFWGHKVGHRDLL